MGRPRKVVQPEREPRSMQQINADETAAFELYVRFGGNDIELALEALRNTMMLYDAQRNGRTSNCYDDPEPTVTPYEARMTSAKIATLSAQREKKLEYCRALVAEAAEHERLKAEAAQDQQQPEAEATLPAKPAAEAAGDETQQEDAAIETSANGDALLGGADSLVGGRADFGATDSASLCSAGPTGLSGPPVHTLRR